MGSKYFLLFSLVLCVLGETAAAVSEIKQDNVTRQSRVNHNRPGNMASNGFCNQGNGVCMNRLECSRGGGTANGFGCGPYKICCETILTCDASKPLKQKHSLIKNPVNIPGRCTYTIQPFNPNVCQVKITFRDLKLQPPTVIPTAGNVIQHRECQNQFLSIEGLDFNLCGDNSGQTIYLPIDQTPGSFASEVSLQFVTDGPSTTASSWNIEITQLECPPPAQNNKNGIFTIPRQSTLQDIRRMLTLQSSNVDEIVPFGCTQYYPEETGTITSLNYDPTGVQGYVSNMKYSICIKRGPDHSNIQFTPTKFQLGSNSDPINMEPEVDELCRSSIKMDGISNDYLMIPPDNILTDLAPLDPVFFCGAVLSAKTLINESKGPFVMMFNSDNIIAGTEQGFVIGYAVN